MTSVAALTSGRLTPSSRFRVRQHIPLLLQYGFEVSEFVPVTAKDDKLPWIFGRVRTRYVLPMFILWQAWKLAVRAPGLLGSWRSDITWLERELLPGFQTLEPLLAGPLVLDVDDAIWTSKPFGASSVAKIARRADVVVAGNNYLADWFSTYARDVRIVPTAIDIDRFHPEITVGKKDNGPFIVGWTGSGGNLNYVYAIEAAIGRFLHNHPDSIFHVLSDQPPRFLTLSPNQVRFTLWSPANEAEVVRSWHVGIMPLPDDEFAKGKCAFKMLQYMACGLPVVISPVGMNREILMQDNVGMAASSDDDWFDALSVLYADRSMASALGLRGREVVKKSFSTGVVSRIIADVFRGLA